MPVFGGEEAIVEVKTRGPAAFKRWQAMGAEISHPDSVAQAAVYSHGKFAEARHVVIATMDTGSRSWDYEVIPAPRVTTALEKTRAWLGPLAQHLAAAGPDPDALPDRDFEAGGWRCKGCPFLAVCRPGEAEPEVQAVQETEVTEEEAPRRGHRLHGGTGGDPRPGAGQARGAGTLKAWMRGRSNGKESIGGRTVSLVRTTRFAVNHRRLSALLDPETRAEVVTERTSEHLRVA